MEHSINTAPEAPSLIYPANGDFGKLETTEFIFTIPDPRAGNSKLHFKVELDTVSTFDSSNLVTFESRFDQTGWYYDSTGSGDWVSIPVDGVDIPGVPALIGNQAKFRLQTEDKLTHTFYYWRAVALGVG